MPTRQFIPPRRRSNPLCVALAAVVFWIVAVQLEGLVSRWVDSLHGPVPYGGYLIREVD